MTRMNWVETTAGSYNLAEFGPKFIKLLKRDNLRAPTFTHCGNYIKILTSKVIQYSYETSCGRWRRVWAKL